MSIPLFSGLTDRATDQSPDELHSIFNDMSGNKTRDTEQAGTCRAFAADLVRVCGQPQLNAVTPQNTPFELVGRTGIICAQLSDEDANARAYQLWDGEGELPSELLSAATLQFWRLPQSEDEIVTTSDGTELLASDEAYVYNPHDGFVEAWISAAWEQRVVIGDSRGDFWYIKGTGHRRHMGRKLARPGTYRIRAKHNRGDGVWRSSRIALVADHPKSRSVGVEDGANNSWDDTLIRFFTLL